MKSTEGCLRGSSQFTGVIPWEVTSNCNGLRAFHKETLHHEERPIFQTDSVICVLCGLALLAESEEPQVGCLKAPVASEGAGLVVCRSQEGLS